MGGAVIGIIGSLVSSIAGSLFSKKATNKADNAREEAANIETANQKNQDREARRKKLADERRRKATILALAQNTGAEVSSGAQGSVGALHTNVTAAVGQQSGQQKAAEGITNQNVLAAKYDRKAQEYAAYGDIFSSFFGAVGKLGAKSGGGLFG